MSDKIEVPTPKLTDKSTKKEFQGAYANLLKKVKEANKVKTSPVQVAERKRQAGVVGAAGTYTAEKAVADLGEFKFKTITAMSRLADDFQGEVDKFKDLREAVTLAEKELEDVHGIKRMAESLEALELTNKAMVEEATAECDAIRLEIDNYTVEFNAKKIQDAKDLRTARVKEEEEFKYDLRIARRNEQDQYEQAMNAARNEHVAVIAKEKDELVVRENALIEKELELARLREVEESKETELKIAGEVAVADAKKSWEASQHIKSLTEKRTEESQLALLKEQCKHLTSRSEELQSEVTGLKNELIASNNKVENIAEKAIQAAAQSKITVNQEAPSGKR